MLAVTKLVATQVIEEPVFSADAMAGREVAIAVWSRKEVNWTKARAGMTMKSLFRGRTWI